MVNDGICWYLPGKMVMFHGDLLDLLVYRTISTGAQQPTQDDTQQKLAARLVGWKGKGNQPCKGLVKFVCLYKSLQTDR